MHDNPLKIIERCNNIRESGRQHACAKLAIPDCFVVLTILSVHNLCADGNNKGKECVRACVRISAN